MTTGWHKAYFLALIDFVEAIDPCREPSLANEAETIAATHAIAGVQREANLSFEQCNQMTVCMLGLAAQMFADRADVPISQVYDDLRRQVAKLREEPP